MTYFKGTEYENTTCPRRHVLTHPDVTHAIALHNACDGKPGVDFFDDFSCMTADAFRVISAAESERTRQHSEEAEREKRHSDAQRRLK